MSRETFGTTADVPGNTDVTEEIVELEDGPGAHVYQVKMHTGQTQNGAVEASVFAGEDRIAPTNDTIAPTATAITLETDYELSPSGSLELRAENESSTAQTVTVTVNVEWLYDDE